MNGKINLGNKEKRENKLLFLLACIMFYGYIAFLLWRVLFYAYGSYYRSSSEVINYNLIPFKTIISYLKGFNRYPFDVWFFNLFGNVMAFLPLGFFVPIVSKKGIKIKNNVFVAVVMSSSIEILQIITRLGSFDIDDIILNTIGTLIGFIGFKIIKAYIINNKKN